MRGVMDMDRFLWLVGGCSVYGIFLHNDNGIIVVCCIHLWCVDDADGIVLH